MLGADVVAVTSGNMTLKDATNEAIRDWCCNPTDTFYVIGSTVGAFYHFLKEDGVKLIAAEAAGLGVDSAGFLCSGFLSGVFGVGGHRSISVFDVLGLCIRRQS